MRNLKALLILLLVLPIAYLPLSTFHFALKNDAFSDNFPVKYFFSAAIHSGNIPLWNPYLNFGFPIYADPGFAFWSPFTWVWGLIGYNAYIFTTEVLVYLYISGVTMFYLGRHFKLSIVTAVCIASMYMCSGFFVGSLQYINFLTSAAFLPLLVLLFNRLQEKPDFKNAFFCSLGYYLIACSGHPSIPAATVYFLGFYSIFYVLFRKDKIEWRKIFIYNSLAVLLFILFFLPAIYSYLNILSVYSIPIETMDNRIAGFSFASFVSLLYPFSTASNLGGFVNDVAMRSIYFSIAGFCFIWVAVKLKNSLVYVFLLSGLFMIILSMGGEIKSIFYSKLPLLNIIRVNGEFRVFTVLCFTIAAGFGLEEIRRSLVFPKLYKSVLKAIAALSIVIIIYEAFNFGPFPQIEQSLSLSFMQEMKTIIDQASFSFYLIISSSITLLIAISLILLKRTNSLLLPLFIIADLIINAIIFLPITGVGQASLSEIQSVYNQFPQNIPIPELIPINKIDTFDRETAGLLGDRSFYDKQIGITKLTGYPSYFKSTTEYLKSDLKNVIEKQPFIFFQSDLNSPKPGLNISVKEFSTQKIVIQTDSPQPDHLVLLQNYYKYWYAKVNNKKVIPQKIWGTFMSVPIPAGNNTISFEYKDPWLFPLVLFSFSSLIFFAVFFMRKNNQRQAREVTRKRG